MYAVNRNWLHNPCLLEGPQQGDGIRSGCTNPTFLGALRKCQKKTEHFQYKHMGGPVLPRSFTPSDGAPKFSDACQFLNIGLYYDRDLSNILAPQRGGWGGGEVRDCTWAVLPAPCPMQLTGPSKAWARRVQRSSAQPLAGPLWAETRAPPCPPIPVERPAGGRQGSPKVKTPLLTPKERPQSVVVGAHPRICLA